MKNEEKILEIILSHLKVRLKTSDMVALNEAAKEIQGLMLSKERVIEYELSFCETCIQMTNHLNGICQKCKSKERQSLMEKYGVTESDVEAAVKIYVKGKTDPESDIAKHPTGWRDFTMTDKESVPSAEEINTADLIQFITNALYRAHDEDMKTSLYNEFDAWVESMTESIQQHIKTNWQPINYPDNRDAIIKKCEELIIEKLNNLSNRYGVIEDKFGVIHYVIIKHDLDYTISELESELSSLKGKE